MHDSRAHPNQGRLERQAPAVMRALRRGATHALVAQAFHVSQQAVTSFVARHRQDLA